jgi:hypothetical protein
MHDHVHLMIVTSLSMIMTFLLHCIMEHTPSRDSFLRLYWFDLLRDYGLLIRCIYNQGIGMYHFLIMVLSMDSHFVTERPMWLPYHQQ